MKITFALAALLLMFAQPTLAQGYQGKSDDFVCNHGDPADPATSEACIRLRGPASGPGSGQAQNATVQGAAETETVSPATAPPASAAAKTPAPVPTDVGESPLGSGGAADTADSAANAAGSDNNEVTSNQSDHWPWRWFHVFGALAIVAVVLTIFAGLAIYFIPTLIALSRRKRNTPAIFALNLFLGWSFIGWVVALIWSLSVDSNLRT